MVAASQFQVYRVAFVSTCIFQPRNLQDYVLDSRFPWLRLSRQVPPKPRSKSGDLRLQPLSLEIYCRPPLQCQKPTERRLLSCLSVLGTIQVRHPPALNLISPASPSADQQSPSSPLRLLPRVSCTFASLHLSSFFIFLSVLEAHFITDEQRLVPTCAHHGRPQATECSERLGFCHARLHRECILTLECMSTRLQETPD